MWRGTGPAHSPSSKGSVEGSFPCPGRINPVIARFSPGATLIIRIDANDVDDAHPLMERVQSDGHETDVAPAAYRHKDVTCLIPTARSDSLLLVCLPVWVEAEKNVLAQDTPVGGKHGRPRSQRQLNDGPEVVLTELTDLNDTQVMVTDGSRAQTMRRLRTVPLPEAIRERASRAHPAAHSAPGPRSFATSSTDRAATARSIGRSCISRPSHLTAATRAKYAKRQCLINQSRRGSRQ